MMRIEIITLFPQLFETFVQTSLVGKAVEKQLVEINCTQLRDFADPPHFKVDDLPYGGGAGMLLKPEPLYRAIESAKSRLTSAKVILLTPSGLKFQQSVASDFSKYSELIFICGRYEGVDQRVIDLMVDFEISIGDYVLMGGELPAMVVLEAILRLRPDVIGNEASIEQESFSSDGSGKEILLESPHYTRPPDFLGKSVPEVLLSGDHQAIARWRHKKSIEKTKTVRPDLLDK